MFHRLIKIPLIHGLFFVLLSCAGKAVTPQVTGEVTKSPPDPAPEIRRKIPKKWDPVKQERCKKVSKNACGEDKECEDICDDIFNSRKDRQKCHELPGSLVSGFETLLSDVEDGDIEDLNLAHLECLLDIDDTEFAKVMRKLSRKEAKSFLLAVILDSDLANILEDEDDEFVILKQVLNRAFGSNNLKKQLGDEIENDKGLLWLAGEQNEQAWKWVDNYVGDICDRGSSDCPGGDNIVAYCSTLLDTKIFKRSDLEDFLSDTDIFAEEYEDDVQDDDYSYEITNDDDRDENGDFRDWCQNEIITPSLPCPAAGEDLPTNKRIRIGTQSSGANPTYEAYVQGKFCEYHSADSQGPTSFTDWTSSDSNSYRGSSSPQQDIIWVLTGATNESLVIVDSELNYDSSKKYYLYVGSNKYELTNPIRYREDCGPTITTTRDLVLWNGFLGADTISGNGPHDVWLASDKNNSNCVFYR